LDDPSVLYTKSYNSVFSIPFGYNDFTVSYNHANYRNFVQGSGNTYSNKGGSKVYKFDFNRVIHRNGNGKTIVSAGIGGDDYENYLADNKIEISTYKVRKYDFGINHQRRFTQGVVACGLTFTYGINKGFISNFSNLKSPAKYFNRINFNGSLLKNLPVKLAKRNLQYHLQIDGQYSPDLLVASEKSTLGGLGSVRGFKDYSENSDNMIVARNELTGFIATGNSRLVQRLFGDISIFTAFDIGYFKNREEIGTRDGVMSGIAAGIKNRDGIVNFSLTLARPIETPVNYKHKNIFYFSVAIDV